MFLKLAGSELKSVVSRIFTIFSYCIYDSCYGICLAAVLASVARWLDVGGAVREALATHLLQHSSTGERHVGIWPMPTRRSLT